MATWTLTFLPTQQVLLNGGEMGLNKLINRLVELDPRRFRDKGAIARHIETYCSCLVNDGRKVKFNKDSDSYAKFSVMERSVQYGLHKSVPDPEKWQLYPLRIRSNSDRCPLGIPWSEVPQDSDYDAERGPYDDHCDINANSCQTGCRIDKEILVKYGYS